MGMEMGIGNSDSSYFCAAVSWFQTDAVCGCGLLLGMASPGKSPPREEEMETSSEKNLPPEILISFGFVLDTSSLESLFLISIFTTFFFSLAIYLPWS
jgi:hypothetical protein